VITKGDGRLPRKIRKKKKKKNPRSTGESLRKKVGGTRRPINRLRGEMPEGVRLRTGSGKNKKNIADVYKRARLKNRGRGDHEVSVPKLYKA